MKTVTILVPVYNEQATIDIFYNKTISVIDALSDYDFELLFINDGSKDGSLELIRNLQKQDERVSYVDLSRNFGKENAMIAGLDYAIGDAVIIMDADLQNPPELLPEFLYWWEEGYEDVCGKRLSREGESFLKKMGTKLYYYLLRKLTHAPVQVDVGDFRLLDKKCVLAMRQMRESQRYTKGLFSWIGYRKKEIPFEVATRVAGETKWNYARLVELAIDGLTSYTTLPLRIAGILGFVVSMLAIIYMLYIIVKTIIYGIDLPGYPSLVSMILFIGGMQLIVLGIIGEYLGKIFNETKNRPLYLIGDYKKGVKHA